MEIIGNPGVNLFDQFTLMSLITKIDRSVSTGRIYIILNDYATAFVHTTYRKLKTHYEMAPTPAFGDRNIDTWGILPSSNPYNPFGDSSDWAKLSKTQKGEAVSFKHRFVEVGPRISDIQSDVLRILPGVKFDIGDSWQAETAFLYNRVESTDFGRNFVSTDALKEALASSDPATAYNIFGAGSGINSPSVLDLSLIHI